MELADQKKKRRLLHLSKTGRRRLLVPTAFFLAVIYYEELFMKLFCFHSLSPAGAFFTLLFSIPVAVLLGLLCGGVQERRGRWLVVICTALLSLWMGSQIVYYHLFKTFLTIFSITKMAMVAGAFGDMAVGQILMNWFPILMMVVPVVLSLVFRDRIVSGEPLARGDRLRWFGVGALVQVAGILLVLLCGGGEPVAAVYLLPGGRAGAGGTELRYDYPDPAGDPAGALWDRSGRPDPAQAGGAHFRTLPAGGEEGARTACDGDRL